MKRKLIIFLLLSLLLTCLTVPAAAQSAASNIDSYITVNNEGDCMVNLTVTLHLDGSTEKLSFPLPANAKNITLNKASVRTDKTDAAINVDISKLVNGLSGDFSMQFDYELPKIITVYEEENLKEKLTEEKKLQLDLPMLCGFSYPVEKFSFVINFPNKILGEPHFSSVYRQSTSPAVILLGREAFL